MKSLILLILPAVLTLPAFAIEPPETAALVLAAPSRALLQERFIFAKTGGTVPVRIESAIAVLREPAFLTRVQEEYERLLPPGKQPDFKVQQSSSNAWFYINQNRERTDITQAAERLDSAGTFDLAYHTQGLRFFGEYQALIHIRLAGCGDSTGYTVAVYAYPENGVSRFFARHLHLVEKYFRSKTGEISELAVQLSTRLCAGVSVSPSTFCAAATATEQRFVPN